MKLRLRRRKGDIWTDTRLILRRTSINTLLLRMRDTMKRRGIATGGREEQVSISLQEAIVFLGGLTWVMGSLLPDTNPHIPVHHLW
jgi:hypothetical protein